MKSGILFTGAVLALTLATVSPVQAAPFDARRCSAIRDVDLPYEVSDQGGVLSFTQGAERITVSATAIGSGGKVLDDPALAAAYSASLRDFLGAARRVPLVSATFGRDVGRGGSDAETRKGFLGSLTDMCRAILTVSEVQGRVARAFPGFVAPVKISLGG